MNALRSFRLVTLLEGLSFLLLLFVAMPLKYMLGLPIAVRVAGSIHGLLFILFVAALVRAATARNWPLGRSLTAFGAALVPGGNFVLDRALRRELDTLASAVDSRV